MSIRLSQTLTWPAVLPSSPSLCSHLIVLHSRSPMPPRCTAPPPGADFIECDVVLTADLVPLCRHEPNLASSTDALAKFPDRRRSYVIDGEQVTGVFSVDLTAAEVATLRAVQPWPFRDQTHNGRYAVATLADYLQVARVSRVVAGRQVGGRACRRAAGRARVRGG